MSDSISDLFEEQRSAAVPLTAHTPQILKERRDYFDEPFRVGDVMYFVGLKLNADIARAPLEIVNVCERSFGLLERNFTYEKHSGNLPIMRQNESK